MHKQIGKATSYPSLHRIQIVMIPTPTMPQYNENTYVSSTFVREIPDTAPHSMATTVGFAAYILNWINMIASSAIVPRDPINHGRLV